TSTHFEMQLPAGCSIDNVEATNMWTAMYSNEGGVVGAISTTANAFSGEGDIAKVTMTVAAKEEGSYPVSISNIRINGTTLDATATFNVVVVSAHTIVLDENTTTIPEAASAVNVRVIRTIAAGNWSTICLPFAMSEAQVKEAFGSDVQLGDFNGYETLEDDGDIVGITVKFNTATSIEANHPYIIKVSAPITEFALDGVDIDPEEEPTVAAVKRTKKQWSEMIGTYVAGKTLDATTLFLSGNQFWYSAGSTTIKAFRAYFDFYDVLTSVENEYAGSHLFINFAEEETGITEVTDSSNNAVSYDLFGRRVENNARGLYIRNAQKVMIK
ncbi:MAG: hypothetical protein J6W47_01490, partial [Bacteroidales bacterium]|nr:hypothetical protein [Bacteroidales bacterium]